ncbi:MAG: ion transporter [Paludibacteraceae bacterium]|nr:ion transporter [Paludibacteraceae bacterium]
MNIIRKCFATIRDREKLYEIIFGTDTPAGKAFDILVMVSIILSIAISIVGTKLMALNFEWMGTVLMIMEAFFMVFFTIEYLLRLYCTPRWKDYAFSFFGIIDFLATFPAYLVFCLPAAQYMLLLRAFRLIRVFRIFKLFSFMNEGYLLMESLRRSAKKISVYFLFVIVLVIAIGTLMFIVEGGTPHSQFTDLSTSIYWAIVTLTTVGYGDITPVTSLGRFLSSLVMILGYTIIAVPTGIVSASIIDTTKEKARDNKCPRCNAEVKPDDNYCHHCGEKL